MTESQLKDLIDRYLNGRATRQEASLIDRFYSHVSESKSGSHAWDEMEKTRIKNRLYHKIHHRIRTQKVRKTRLLISSAAAVLLLVLTFYIVVNQNNEYPAYQTSISIITTTAETEQRSILLSDGSYVLLSPRASLSYPEEFGTEIRRVTLTGEAWFDVQRDTTMPFQVVANHITTTVLGTSFSISSDPGNTKVAVKVTSGRVQVASEDKELAVLEKDDQLEYEAGEYTVSRVDQHPDRQEDQLPEPGNWKLANVTMAEAMAFLEKRWGKSFTFDNPDIRDCPLYATFNADDPLQEVLMIICGVSNADYKLENDKIIIYGEGCEQQRN